MSTHLDEVGLKKVRRVYAFWGRFSALYRAQDAITFLGRAKKIRGDAIKRLDLKKGDRVLEVACGLGSNFPYLVDAVGTGGMIVGTDYSQEMLDAAKRLCERHGWNNVKLVRDDAAQLLITEKHFDGIVSVLGMSAVPGWEQAIRRCYDLLRPSGKLVVCDARLFHGMWSLLNPLVRTIYSTFAAWDPSKNIPEKMKEVFGNVEVENRNAGTFYVALSVKNQ